MGIQPQEEINNLHIRWLELLSVVFWRVVIKEDRIPLVQPVKRFIVERQEPLDIRARNDDRYVRQPRLEFLQVLFERFQCRFIETTCGVVRRADGERNESCL